MWILTDKYKNKEHLIGPFVKFLREDIGMTQKDLSDETGFSIQTISKIENCKTHPRTFAAKSIIEKLIDICETNGYDTEKMFDVFCFLQSEQSL